MANRPDATEKLKKQLSIFKFEVPSFKGPGLAASRIGVRRAQA